LRQTALFSQGGDIFPKSLPLRTGFWFLRWHPQILAAAKKDNTGYCPVLLNMLLSRCMNAPHINVQYIHSFPFGSAEWAKAIVSEDRRCCGQIDARINKIHNERMALYEEYAAVEKQLETEQGFFARIKLTLKLRRIDKELEWRRKVMIELLDARIVRTYASK
jgi:hypothetical protein